MLCARAWRQVSGPARRTGETVPFPPWPASERRNAGRRPETWAGSGLQLRCVPECHPHWDAVAGPPPSAEVHVHIPLKTKRRPGAPPNRPMSRDAADSRASPKGTQRCLIAISRQRRTRFPIWSTSEANGSHQSRPRSSSPGPSSVASSQPRESPATDFPRQRSPRHQHRPGIIPSEAGATGA